MLENEFQIVDVYINRLHNLRLQSLFTHMNLTADPLTAEQ